MPVADVELGLRSLRANSITAVLFCQARLRYLHLSPLQLIQGQSIEQELRSVLALIRLRLLFGLGKSRLLLIVEHLLLLLELVPVPVAVFILVPDLHGGLGCLLRTEIGHVPDETHTVLEVAVQVLV